MDETFETGEKVETMTDDYLAAIQQLKQTTVNRSDYDALKAENKKLLDAVLNGAPATETKPVHIEPLAPDAFLDKLVHAKSHLEYFETVLNQRNALVLSGEEDPFLPPLRDGIPSEDDRKAAETVLSEFTDCIEIANGSPEIFQAEWFRRCAPGKSQARR